MDIEKFVAQRLENLLVKKEITRYKVSQRTGISQNALSNILHMKQTPTLYTVERICEALEITLAEFFTSPETIVGLTEEQKEFLCYLDDMNEDEKRFLKGLLQSLREKK